IDRQVATAGPLAADTITLLHSGVVYTSERDPTQFFQALGRLKRERALGKRKLLIRFRASSNDGLLRSLAKANDIEDLIELLPPLKHRESLVEMLRADGLLVLQASNCNEQIPGKLYEYVRARRPILGLTDPGGDTAQLIRSAGVEDIVPLDDAAAIAATLQRWIGAIEQGTAAIPPERFISANTRAARAGELAHLLDATIATDRPAPQTVTRAASDTVPVANE